MFSKPRRPLPQPLPRGEGAFGPGPIHAFKIVFLLLLSVLPLRAETVDSIPNPLRTQRSWISDGAQVIDAANKLQINRTIENLQHRTTAEIAVVTVQNTGDLTPAEFATALLNRWGVGKKGKDNGVLVLLSMEARKVKVETGYGVEGELPDGKVGELLDEYAVPRFKQGDFGGGLLALVGQIAAVLSDGAVGAPPSAAPVTKPRPATSRPAPARPAIALPAPLPAAPRYTPPAAAPVYNAPPSSGPFDVIIGLFILMMLPLGAGALIWGIMVLFRKMNTRHCPQCKREMRYLSEVEDDSFLDEAQRLEERLGGLDWRVWRCDACGIQHIERSVKWFGGYEDCPRCSHHTVQVSSITLREPTYYSEGLRETTRTCHFPDCNYVTRTQQILPRRERETVVVTSGGSSWGGSSSSDSSSSDAGFSSSSSDFGGGSSGGGGAERGW